MSFKGNSFSDIAIDDIVNTIFNELKNNGAWVEIDSGYKVLRNVDATFDIYFALEATNKRWLYIQIGENGQWNTGTHSMDTPYLESSIVIFDSASAASGSTEGIIKMGYDTDHLILYVDYAGAGGSYTKGMSYHGELTPLATGDECIIGVASPYRGATAIPPYDGIGQGECKIIRDIAGSASKPIYKYVMLATVGGSWSSGNPSTMRTYAVKPNKRYLIPIYLLSDTSLSGGEEAGLRCYMKNLYHGGAFDAEANGETLEAIDGATFQYYNATSTYFSFAMRNWFRTS